MRWPEPSTILLLLAVLGWGIVVLVVGLNDMADAESPNAPLIGSLVRIADSHSVCGEYMGRRESYIVQSSRGDTYYIQRESQLVNVDSCN